MAPTRDDQARTDPSAQIPEADLLEQRTPLDPTLTDQQDEAIGRASSGAAPVPVDDADRWEQQQDVPAAEDDYPHYLSDHETEAR